MKYKKCLRYHEEITYKKIISWNNSFYLRYQELLFWSEG
jgi:hypothetical protein